MKVLGNKIKDLVAIQSSIKRISHQIYENNLNESKIIIVGISKKGYVLCQHIGAILKTISNIEITLVKLEIDKNLSIKKHLFKGKKITDFCWDKERNMLLLFSNKLLFIPSR